MLHRKRPAVIAHAVTMDKQTKVTWILFFTAAGNAQVCLIWGRSWGYKKLLYDSCTDYWHRRRNKDNKDVADMGRCCCSTFSVTYVIQRKIMSIKITSLLKSKKTICFCWHFLKCVICHSAFPAVCLPLLSPLLRVSHPKSLSAIYGLQGPVTISYFYLGLGFMMWLLIRICQTNFISASSYFI